MPPKSKVTLSNSQRYEFCLFAGNNKLTRKEYVDWIEQKWGIKVVETTITRILQKKEEILNTEVTNPDAKRLKNLTVPELELALKEFILIYQDRVILSDVILLEKAKKIANGLGEHWLSLLDGSIDLKNGMGFKYESFKERHHQLI